MDELKRLAAERDRKHLSFIIKARDLSLKNLYLLTTFGRQVEQLESSDFEVNYERTQVQGVGWRCNGLL